MPVACSSGDQRGERGPAGWEARLSLEFTSRSGATLLSRRAHVGPLAVQRPFFPEGRDVCHVYLLHPPGGVVGGDRLHVDVTVHPGAHALVTTPAATKFYRTAGPLATVDQRLRVASGATLEWLPQEAILHDGAHVDIRTRVDLDGGARVVATDALCFGLPARPEEAGFARGRCRQAVELWRDGRPLVIERGMFDGDSAVHAGRWGLAGAPITALLLAAPVPAPADGALLAALRALAGELLVAAAGDLGAATVVNDAALAVRYVGASAERARRYLQAAWRLVRPPLLGRAAEAPRIWAT